MRRIAQRPWHWWVILALVVAGFTVFVLSYALDWQNSWIRVGALAVSALGVAYTFWVLWIYSDPKRRRD